MSCGEAALLPFRGAHEQPRIVGADRAGADENRVAGGAEFIDFIESASVESRSRSGEASSI